MEEQLLFSKDHIWLRLKEETAWIGISDYAQKELGSILFLNLPEEGRQLEIGRCFGDVESIKNVSELISPVSGRVVRVNDGLLEEPERIHETPYESWLIMIKVDKIAEDMMVEKKYLEYKDGL